MADFTVFYSWQMDAPKEINKDFIHAALSSAVNSLGKAFEIEEADRLTIDVEQGMKGVPGSPEIATMMLEKIGESAIYVGDVSLVGAVKQGKRILKKIPNPNVNIEEGFAAGVLGWERVICVANDFFGTSEEQAVDQRNRRYPITYRLAPDTPAAERDKIAVTLANNLKIAIGTVKKYELRKAEKALAQLDISTTEMISFYQNAQFFPQPETANPAAPIAVLRDLDLWRQCLVRLLDLRLVRTDLGVDEANQARYSYWWTMLGTKVGDLIKKKTTKL